MESAALATDADKLAAIIRVRKDLNGFMRVNVNQTGRQLKGYRFQWFPLPAHPFSGPNLSKNDALPFAPALTAR